MLTSHIPSLSLCLWKKNSLSLSHRRNWTCMVPRLLPDPPTSLVLAARSWCSLCLWQRFKCTSPPVRCGDCARPRFPLSGKAIAGGKLLLHTQKVAKHPGPFGSSFGLGIPQQIPIAPSGDGQTFEVPKPTLLCHNAIYLCRLRLERPLESLVLGRGGKDDEGANGRMAWRGG